MIQRILQKEIQDRLFKGKVILIFGSRQVGKTTLLKNISKTFDKVQWFNADEVEVQSLFETASLSNFKSFLTAYPNAITKIITPENYHEFITQES